MQNWTLIGLDAQGWITLAIGALLGTLLSIPVGWLFWRMRPRRRLEGLTQLTADIGGVGAPTIPELTAGLEFVFEGRIVPSVTVTSIGIWNSAREAVTADRLRGSLAVEVVGTGDLLQVSVQSQSAEHVRASVGNVDPGRGALDFDFMNEGDGLVVQVIHTAGVGGVRLAGQVVGQSGGIIRYRHPAENFARRALAYSFGATLLLTAIVAVGTAVSTSLGVPSGWAAAASSVPAFVVMVWGVFGAGPRRAFRRLPAVVRDSPGLLAAGWPPF